MARFEIGIDIGGTFTDLLLADLQSGRLILTKVLTDRQDPGRAVLIGIEELLSRSGISMADIGLVVHGTTLGLNTLVERNGARTGILVTKGFRDMLELARLRLPITNYLYAERPKPPVQRRHVLEIDERVSSSGEALRTLDSSEIAMAAERFREAEITAVAICFLHSYANPSHETLAEEELARHLPGAFISPSSRVWPQQREYERAITTVLNAYIGSRVSEYFKRLNQEIQRRSDGSSHLIAMKSNGGVMSADEVGKRPIETVLSGPAGGVMGATFVAEQLHEEKIIAFDIGGTTADVCILHNARSVAHETEIEGFPIVTPSVSVSSIGAGGGSIARVDSSGVIKVGPDSAGSTPGPAAYGNGGALPTLTDAYIVCGLLPGDAIAGKSVSLTPSLARDAINEHVAIPLGLSAEGAGRAVIEVATANMFARIMSLTAKLGSTPSEYALVAYGGAGPTHAMLLARELGIHKVLVPRYPGAMSALGCLRADLRGDFIQSIRQPCIHGVAERLRHSFTDLEGEADAWLSAQNIRVEQVEFIRSLDMRYLGQSFELNVELPHGHDLDHIGLATLFHHAHEETYGHHDSKAQVLIVGIRVQIVGQRAKYGETIDEVETLAENESPPAPEFESVVHLNSSPSITPCYRREDLKAGVAINGPLIIVQADTTTYAPPDWIVNVTRFGTLVLEDRHGD